MTEPTEQTQVDEREIEFQGRQIWVCLPTSEQILVWQRTLKQLQSAEVNDWNGMQVLAALERTRKIIDSVILNQTDKDWLDDEMLERRVTLKDTAAIIQKTLDAFAPETDKLTDNRATRRAATKKAAPVKKAVRKRVTT